MNRPDPPLLTLDGLAVGYGRQAVLANLDLRLPRGSFTALLGANGSGKSTLIRTLLGILPPLAGRLEYPPVDGRAPVLGYVPQRESLDPIYLLSGLEVVLMGLCGRVRPGRFLRGADRDRARRCLEQAGAEALAARPFAEVSGGQKQRVLIARALVTEPDFLVLDEPTSGIDLAAKQAIMDLLRRLHAERGLALLMASHDLPVVRRYAQRAVWLRAGRLVEGPVAELLGPGHGEAVLDLELH
jgi:ABC-type Mn2+/Zn2+ transport system ATPase subunit